MKAPKNGYISNIYSPSREWFREPFARKLKKLVISQLFTLPQEKGSVNHSCKSYICQVFPPPKRKVRGTTSMKAQENSYFSIIYSPSREWFREPLLRELHLPSISFPLKKGSGNRLCESPQKWPFINYLLSLKRMVQGTTLVRAGEGDCLSHIYSLPRVVRGTTWAKVKE